MYVCVILINILVVSLRRCVGMLAVGAVTGCARVYVYIQYILNKRARCSSFPPSPVATTWVTDPICFPILLSRTIKTATVSENTHGPCMRYYAHVYTYVIFWSLHGRLSKRRRGWRCVMFSVCGPHLPRVRFARVLLQTHVIIIYIDNSIGYYYRRRGV